MLTAFAIGFAKEMLDYLIYSFNFVLYVLEKKNLCQTPDRVGIYKISPELILSGSWTPFKKSNRGTPAVQAEFNVENR